MKRKEIIENPNGKKWVKYVFKKHRYEITCKKLWELLKTEFPNVRGVVLAEDDVPLEDAEIDVFFDNEIDRDTLSKIEMIISTAVDEEWVPLNHPYMSLDEKIIHLTSLMEKVKVKKSKEYINAKLKKLKLKHKEKQEKLKQIGGV